MKDPGQKLENPRRVAECIIATCEVQQSNLTRFNMDTLLVIALLQHNCVKTLLDSHDRIEMVYTSDDKNNAIKKAENFRRILRHLMHHKCSMECAIFKHLLAGDSEGFINDRNYTPEQKIQAFYLELKGLIRGLRQITFSGKYVTSAKCTIVLLCVFRKTPTLEYEINLCCISTDDEFKTDFVARDSCFDSIEIQNPTSIKQFMDTILFWKLQKFEDFELMDFKHVTDRCIIMLREEPTTLYQKVKVTEQGNLDLNPVRNWGVSSKIKIVGFVL